MSTEQDIIEYDSGFNDYQPSSTNPSREVMSSINYNQFQPHCNNPVLASGCKIEGHSNQQILHIFINERENKEFGKERFGCAECVTRRHEDRTLSLHTAVQVEKYHTLYKFPALEPKNQQEVIHAIEVANSIKFDEEINTKLDDFIEQLRNILEKKKQEGIQFANDIKSLGEEMRNQYKQITDCSEIRDCLRNNSDDYENLNKHFDQIIRRLYDQQQDNEKKISSNTLAYIDKNNTFRRDYADNLQKQMIDTIDKISFERLSKDKMAPVPSISKEEYLKIPQRLNYQPFELHFTQLEVEDQTKKTNGVYVLSMEPGLTKLKKFFNQANSSTLLPNLTYKFEFELNGIDKDKSFQIGLADKDNIKYNICSGNNTTPFLKVFNLVINVGCNFVDYGQDLSVIANPNQYRFFLKLNISKNLFKFYGENKTSSNSLATNEKLDQTKQYCLYIVNSSFNFSLKICNVTTK